MAADARATERTSGGRVERVVLGAVAFARALPRILVGALIALYRVSLSHVIGGRCRFVPSCSEYAQEAVARYGAARGLWLTSGRLSRCHPWCAPGYDPVPELRS